MKRVFLLVAAAGALVACGGEDKKVATAEGAEAIVTEEPAIEMHIPVDVRNIKADADLPDELSKALEATQAPTGKTLAQRAAKAIKSNNEAELKAVDVEYYQLPLSEQEAYRAELNDIMSR